MHKEYIEEFRNNFKYLSLKYGEQKILTDFVKMFAISIYNSFAKNQQMEQEYLATINTYNKEAQQLFPKMLGNLIMIYETSNDIIDIFSKLYEDSSLGSSHLGQYFTPTHISTFMGEIALQEEQVVQQEIEEKGFITMLEPACGAGRNDTWFCKSIKKIQYKLSTTGIS